MRARPLAMVLSVLSLAGCGGDSSGPSDAFPSVAGTYSVFAGFDQLSATEGSATGTVTITQGSRSVGTLAGTMTMLVTVDGDLFQLTSPLTSANVTQQAQLTFTGGQNGVSWVFSGALINNALSGRHTLLSGSSSISGNWSGARTAAAAAHFAVGAIGTDLRGAVSALVRR
jgi:hypothetical protein